MTKEFKVFTSEDKYVTVIATSFEIVGEYITFVNEDHDPIAVYRMCKMIFVGEVQDDG